MPKRCFVISPFGAPFDDYYKEIFTPAILAAGLEVFRADDIYGVGPIMQDVWDSIRESSVVLADLTTKNPNVFYELGIAHSYQKPVILLSKTMEDVPFDLRHYRVIIYNTAGVFWAKELKERITNTVTYLLESSSLPNDFFRIDTGNPTNMNHGITKYTNSSSDRISDYKSCLQLASGLCFITGTSMVHISDDSADIILEKLPSTEFRLLIMDPQWIKVNHDILTFLSKPSLRKNFYLEIENSIQKFVDLRSKAPRRFWKKLSLKSYKTFFPYIMTGYEQGSSGQVVVELTDYLPESTRPRITLSKMESATHRPFEQVRAKFEALWNNSNLTRRIEI